MNPFLPYRATGNPNSKELFQFHPRNCSNLLNAIPDRECAGLDDLRVEAAQAQLFALGRIHKLERVHPEAAQTELPDLSNRGMLGRMSTVEEIKTAISKLSLEERAEMLAELCGWTDDAWDLQMKRDAAAGKFAPLNQAADAAHARGQTTALDQILREP